MGHVSPIQVQTLLPSSSLFEQKSQKRECGINGGQKQNESNLSTLQLFSQTNKTLYHNDLSACHGQMENLNDSSIIPACTPKPRPLLSLFKPLLLTSSLINPFLSHTSIKTSTAITKLPIQSISPEFSLPMMNFGLRLVAKPLSTKSLVPGIPSRCPVMYKGMMCCTIFKSGFSKITLPGEEIRPPLPDDSSFMTITKGMFHQDAQ